MTVILKQDETDGLLFVDKKGGELFIVLLDGQGDLVIPFPPGRNDQGAAVTYDFRKLLED